MSFVCAEKMDDRLDMYCDTKIGLDDFAGATFSEEQLRCVNKLELLK